MNSDGPKTCVTYMKLSIWRGLKILRMFSESAVLYAGITASESHKCQDCLIQLIKPVKTENFTFLNTYS